ncbi:hypothetical protein LXT21_16505 [Myxococcus sp. K38C18041901]|uniref:hypothetical protein n=1 Tax=Myxococcus guangdongensis TaxID=2906760 RepID=UPI0020A821AF|nr:hypothetical protein [Myxococcus guangdongensis]MCP3060382.1 hypothetical protein [Myxococcus guangdongensis]
MTNEILKAGLVVCDGCSKVLSQAVSAPGGFTYRGTVVHHHQQFVHQARHQQVGSNAKVQRYYSEGARPTGAVDRDSKAFATRDDLAKPQPPVVLQIQCMVLFIPFDAGKNFYKKSGAKGTLHADLVPSKGNHFAPLADLTASKALSQYNNAKLPNATAFEKPVVASTATAATPAAAAPTGAAAAAASSSSGSAAAAPRLLLMAELAHRYSDIVREHIIKSTDVDVWMKIHLKGGANMRSELVRFCPEIIFLSEEPTDAPFPDALNPFPQLAYRKIGSLKELLRGTMSVDCKNEIAVYALEDAGATGPSIYSVGHLLRQGVKHQEKWLCVTKRARDFPGAITIAGVHLDSGYTGKVAAAAKEGALETVGKFAQTRGVDALLGDLNMDSAELHGGFFPNHLAFMVNPTDGAIYPVYQVSHSNSSDTKNYMGGLIVDKSRVGLLPLNLRGQWAMSLSRTIDNAYYSDHPAIIIHYVKRLG